MPTDDQPFETLPALLDHAAETYGDEPAVITRAETWSFRQLRAASSELAKGLLAAGVGKGGRVAVLAGNTPFFIVSMFACWRIGALVPALSTLASPDELAYLLRHCDAQALIMGRRFANRDYGEIVARALPSLAKARARGPLRLPEAPFLRQVWADDAEGLPWAGPVAELVEAGAGDPALDDALLDQITAEVSPSDDAVIIYTSGSTMQPKAVLHTQGPMARKAEPLAEKQGITRGYRMLPLAPMFWVGGMNMLLECVAVGSPIILPDGPSTQAAVDAVREFGCDRIYGWPAQTQPMRELMDAEGVDYGHIWNFSIGHLPDGQIVSPDRIPNSLGMTETFGPHCYASPGVVLPEDRRGAFGPVFFDFEQRVVDPDSGEVLGHGEVGELWLRGGSMMKGFYKMERAEAFSPDGFYATHDLVRTLPDGLMYFEGRTGDMLKTKGANVSRLEVEGALRSLPGVGEAVVCGLPDSLMGQRVVAAVVPLPGEQVSEETLIAGVKAKIAAYKAPSRILVIAREDLSWSASGKIRVPEMGRLIADRLGLTLS